MQSTVCNHFISCSISHVTQSFLRQSCFAIFVMMRCYDFVLCEEEKNKNEIIWDKMSCLRLNIWRNIQTEIDFGEKWFLWWIEAKLDKIGRKMAKDCKDCMKEGRFIWSELVWGTNNFCGKAVRPAMECPCCPSCTSPPSSPLQLTSTSLQPLPLSWLLSIFPPWQNPTMVGKCQ